MGILAALRMRDTVGQVQASLPTYTDPADFPIVTPWSSNDLTRIVWQDIFGTDQQPTNTRNAAMRLPAIARSRNLLCATICRLPLRELTGQTPSDDQPDWINSAIDGTSPQLRLAWTVDDLIFYGWSCWWRDNDPTTGLPVAVSRLNQSDWKINDDGRVEVDGTVAKSSDVIVIPGIHEGILSFPDAISDTHELYRIVRSRLLNPAPTVDLHQEGGDPLTEVQIDALIDRWATARRGINGGVGFTNQNIKVNELGAGGDAQLLIEARNAAAVDLARLVGVTASRVDATSPKASLNYETATGRNQELVDFDLALYLTPITARLSLDDVTPAGRRVDFDLSDFNALTPSPAGPPFGD